MNHRHRKLLAQIFAHPISTNLDFSAIRSVLQELGADIENKSGNRIGVSLHGHTVAFSHANHSLPKDEVVQIRKFLESAGVNPEKYPV
jgi:hypothetical protein